MFGTGQLIWPEPMAASISVIEGASYLAPQQKRDIFVQQRCAFPAAGQGGQDIGPAALSSYRKHERPAQGVLMEMEPDLTHRGAGLAPTVHASDPRLLLVWQYRLQSRSDSRDSAPKRLYLGQRQVRILQAISCGFGQACTSLQSRYV